MKRISENTAIAFFAIVCLAMGVVILWRSITATAEDLEAHETRQLAYWKTEMSKPVEERVRLAPAEAIDYLIKDNRRQGWSETPRAIADDGAIKDLKRALAELPEALRRKLSAKLGGVLVATDLGGSALANTIFDENQRLVAGFVTLDANVLNRRANEWATWKESSPFKESQRFRLRARIANDTDDTRIRAYQYILLHEIGHVVSIGERVHPNWDFNMGMEAVSQYAFAAISWSETDGAIKRPESFGGLLLPQARYYTTRDKDRLPADTMIAVYDALERSNFVTLYASTNVFDDFAETFATYVHSRILGRPFEITVMDGDTEMKTFRLCYGQERCAEKERLIREFYESL